MGANSIAALRKLGRYLLQNHPALAWAVCRTMVVKQALRTEVLLKEELAETTAELRSESYKSGQRFKNYGHQLCGGVFESMLYRSEVVNQLSFMQATAFNTSSPALKSASAPIRETIQLLTLELLSSLAHQNKRPAPGTRFSSSGQRRNSHKAAPWSRNLN